LGGFVLGCRGFSLEYKMVRQPDPTEIEL